MKIETVKKLFKCLYPEFEIITIDILPRNKYENGEWIEDTPSVFVGVRINDGILSNNDVSNTLTKLTNREFNVFLT